MIMPTETPPQLEDFCLEKGLRMTPQRRIIAQVVFNSTDHPEAEEIYNRSLEFDSNISLSTVYRTLKLMEDAHILDKHEFKDGRTRYEPILSHHDHLINVETGDVIEFNDPKIEALQIEIAERLGFKLVSHKLELYGVPIKHPRKTKHK